MAVDTPSGLPDIPIDPTRHIKGANRRSAPKVTDRNELGELLGLDADAEGLAAFIRSCEMPLTIGIQGDWGSGKSSLMKLIQYHLRTDPKSTSSCLHLEFNTWQYSQFGRQSQLGISLLQNLSKKLFNLPKAENSNQWPPEGTRKAFRRFAGGLMKAAQMAAGGATAKLSGGLISSDQFAELFKSDAEVVDEATLFEQLRSSFEEIVHSTLKHMGAKRIIVYVDDLDRLEPARAIELLEVIKNFVDVHGCIFVLAIDYDVILRGLSQRKGYSGELQANEGKSFFDKIIQVPYRMPTSTYHSDRFLTERYIELTRPRNEFERWKKVADQYWGESKAIDPATLKADLGCHFIPVDIVFLLRRGRELVEATIGHNPRSIKRLLNLNSLLTLMHQHRSTGRKKTLREKNRTLLLALTAMQMAHFRMYRLLAANASSAEVYLLAWWLAPEIYTRLDALSENDLADETSADDLEDTTFQALIDQAGEIRTWTDQPIGVTIAENKKTALVGAIRLVAGELRAMDEASTLTSSQVVRMGKIAAVLFDAIDIDDSGTFEEKELNRLARLLRLTQTTSVEDTTTSETRTKAKWVTFGDLVEYKLIDPETRLHFYAPRRNVDLETVLDTALPDVDAVGSLLRVRFRGASYTLAQANKLIMNELLEGDGNYPFTQSELDGNVSSAAFWAVERDGEAMTLVRLIDEYRRRDAKHEEESAVALAKAAEIDQDSE